MTLAPVGPQALPSALTGMDRATALAYVSRLFDAAAAGDVLWGDDEIVERFLAQCSRTGSQETRDGYRREINAFRTWLWIASPDRPLREVTPQMA